MNTDEARESFSEAYEGELSEPRRREFDAALAEDSELKQEYAAFQRALTAAGAVPAVSNDGPDLLAGVQRRLRKRSRGRFYGDRFAERQGMGIIHPVALAVGIILKPSFSM